MTRCPIIDRNGVERCTCDVDDVLDFLADARRRAVVSALQAAGDDWIDFDRLVAAVADETPDANAETLRIDLHHVHLPMLEDRGIIDYDSRAGTIRYYRCELIADVLAAVEANHHRG